MRVLIVAKTRRGRGACIGGIAADGKSVRLVDAGAEFNVRAGLEYAVGEVWDVVCEPARHIIPPHVENVTVYSARRLNRVENVEEVIERFMPPSRGGPETLFEGLLQSTPFGALHISRQIGLPSRSTMFWRPDEPLRMDVEGKRIHYRYGEGGVAPAIAFVGFQHPVPIIPAGTLLRISLAHWWRSDERPEDEERCYAQLSGWFSIEESTALVISGSSRVEEAVECVPDMALARRALKSTFGFANFYPLQEQVVNRILRRFDTLVIMPTGGGKSLCYQLPALLMEGLTVVISPLIALMQDQVTQLHQVGVPSGFLNSSLAHQDYLRVAGQVRAGEIRLLYVAPETLLRPETFVLLDQSRVTCFAIDEAHCISEWGHDFRPEYRQIQEARKRFSRAVCVALTATATDRVRKDIRDLLNIPQEGQFVASFNRPNLFLAAQARTDGLGQTLAFLRRNRGESGIIYCSTRKQVDELASELHQRGWPIWAYHAGMDAETRRKNQEAFAKEDSAIMVATIAFGMGINKSNVRFVLHYNLPKDIESYYQEIGRAGRDGLPANCLLLYSRDDAVTIRRFIDAGAESERDGRTERLNAMLRYADTWDCRRGPLLAYFGERLNSACGYCDTCASQRQRHNLEDVTDPARRLFECVRLTGEVFGAAHVIDVLRGSQSKRVLSRKHDTLSCHGSGRDLSVKTWRDLTKRLIAEGFVEQDAGFGSLRLRAKARQVMTDGEGKILVPESAERVMAIPSSPESLDHPELFAFLRGKRRELAQQNAVPAYVIFSDRTLLEMACRLPRSPDDLLKITGVGEAKLASYGPAFLETIADYCAARDGLERAALPEATATEPTPWLKVKKRYQEIGEAFASGKSLDKLAAEFGVKRGTILQNLQRYADAGNTVDPSQLIQSCTLTSSDRDRALAEFDRLGHERLGPIYHAMEGAVSYEELHLLRLWLIARKRPCPADQGSVSTNTL